MSGIRREVYNKLATFKDYVNGKTKYPKGKLQNCSETFRGYGWRICTPYDNSEPNRKQLGEISNFFNTYEGFTTEANDFTDMYALYKIDGHR